MSVSTWAFLGVSGLTNGHPVTAVHNPVLTATTATCHYRYTADRVSEVSGYEKAQVSVETVRYAAAYPSLPSTKRNGPPDVIQMSTNSSVTSALGQLYGILFLPCNALREIRRSHLLEEFGSSEETRLRAPRCISSALSFVTDEDDEDDDSGRISERKLRRFRDFVCGSEGTG